MSKDSIALINGHEYFYKYNPDTKQMDYKGPKGDAPPITEGKFRELFKEEIEVLGVKKSEVEGMTSEELYDFITKVMEHDALQNEFWAQQDSQNYIDESPFFDASQIEMRKVGDESIWVAWVYDRGLLFPEESEVKEWVGDFFDNREGWFQRIKEYEG
jgi:hypothetical protein